MPETNDERLTKRLTKAQDAVKRKIPAIRKERQDAVLDALAGGWSKYRIAAVLGVAGPTVDSIIKTAEKEKQ